jgi:hypothetical protein
MEEYIDRRWMAWKQERDNNGKEHKQGLIHTSVPTLTKTFSKLKPLGTANQEYWPNLDTLQGFTVGSTTFGVHLLQEESGFILLHFEGNNNAPLLKAQFNPPESAKGPRIALHLSVPVCGNATRPASDLTGFRGTAEVPAQPERGRTAGQGVPRMEATPNDL